MANNAFGIDLGTNNIKIYNRNDDNIMIEKNMIAIENKNTLFAYGNSAFEMYEKAPSNIHISYPLSNGVIADIKNMETLVKYLSEICKKAIPSLPISSLRCRRMSLRWKKGRSTIWSREQT